MALETLRQTLGGKIVLIADDDPETILFIVRTLKEHGILTSLVTSQRDGFNLLYEDDKRQRIGLVIVDLQFIGQELPAALLESRQKLGRNATANNTGQALGYWLWERRKENVGGNDWPRYVYASLSTVFWKMAENSSLQEFNGRSEATIRENFVLGKLTRDGEEFCAALDKACAAWLDLEENSSPMGAT